MRGAQGFPPKDAILHIFRLDYQNNNSLPSYLNINGLPDEAKAEMNRLASGGDWDALSSHLVSQWRYASTLHPGLERMTENRAVFEEIVSTYSSGESSDRLFDRISRSNEIKNQFESDCAQQRNHLKEMVCTPPDELLRRVPGRDLQNIISYNSPSTQALELNSAILCDNPRSSPLDSLTNIYNQAYNPDFHSDFREHVNPNGMQTPFKRLMLAEQEVEEIQNEVGEAVITFEENNRGWADNVGGNRFYGDRGGRISDELIAETRRGNFSAELVERVQNSQVANSQVRPMGQTQVSQETTQDERENSTNNFDQTTTSSVAQTNFTNVPTASSNYVSSGTAVTSGRNTSDLPDLDRNPFEFDESEIAEMRSNLSSEQLAELEELKQQAQRDRERLIALTGETQQARIRGLQEQLRQLENRRNQRVADDSTDVPRRESIVGNTNLSQFQNPSQQIDRVSIPSSGRTSLSGGSASLPGAVSSGGSGSSASRLPASVPPVRNNQIQPGAFIITSESTRNGEVASEDLSLEIIRYLSQNNPDLEVLTRIKENGMLYKFKTVENGVEKQREIFIQFDRLTSEARRIVETKIESRRAQSPSSARLEEEITATRRSYSYEALKLIVGQEILRERR